MTSVENPLPVDEKTLFQFGSTGKTFTATAIMRLVEQGKVDLDAPVRTYVPELRLKDEDVAEDVTVLQLLNHTAGWEGDLMDDTGDGDDALEKYVAHMADLEQVTPLGATVSYNNASLSVAGRIIAKVTGLDLRAGDPRPAARAARPVPHVLLPERDHDPPVRGRPQERRGRHDLDRPAVGHGRAATRPAGGMSATAARPDRVGPLPPRRRHRGRRHAAAQQGQPAQDAAADRGHGGSALGDAVGISWLLAEVDGVGTVGHGGTTNGQHSDFTMVPERGFAVISMTNCGPNGPQFNHEVVRWALEHYLGLIEVEPEPIRLPDDELAPYTGQFETIAAVVDITATDGRLSAIVTIKPETAAMLRESGEEVPDEQPPIPLAMLAGKPDNYIVDEGDRPRA